MNVVCLLSYLCSRSNALPWRSACSGHGSQRMHEVAVCGESLWGVDFNISMIAVTCLWRAKHRQHPQRPELRV